MPGQRGIGHGLTDFESSGGLGFFIGWDDFVFVDWHGVNMLFNIRAG